MLKIEDRVISFTQSQGYCLDGGTIQEDVNTIGFRRMLTETSLSIRDQARYSQEVKEAKEAFIKKWGFPWESAKEQIGSGQEPCKERWETEVNFDWFKSGLTGLPDFYYSVFKNRIPDGTGEVFEIPSHSNTCWEKAAPKKLCRRLKGLERQVKEASAGELVNLKSQVLKEYESVKVALEKYFNARFWQALAQVDISCAVVEQHKNKRKEGFLPVSLETLCCRAETFLFRSLCSLSLLQFNRAERCAKIALETLSLERQREAEKELSHSIIEIKDRVQGIRSDLWSLCGRSGMGAVYSVDEGRKANSWLQEIDQLFFAEDNPEGEADPEYALIVALEAQAWVCQRRTV
jgi:hypothetical protein